MFGISQANYAVQRAGSAFWQLSSMPKPALPEFAERCEDPRLIAVVEHRVRRSKRGQRTNVAAGSSVKTRWLGPAADGSRSLRVDTDGRFDELRLCQSRLYQRRGDLRVIEPRISEIATALRATQHGVREGRLPERSPMAEHSAQDHELPNRRSLCVSAFKGDLCRLICECSNRNCLVWIGADNAK